MLKVKRDKISSETAELKKIEAELKELKDKIAEFLKIREENSKSFQRYIQLKEKFSRLEEITNRLRELDGARNEADVRLSELKSRIDYLSGVYSPEEHLKLKEELTNLVKKKGELEGKLQNIASGIEEVRSEIEILIEKENELGHAKKAMKILEEKYDFIKRLREIFKLAIPEIIRAFVDAVSLQANRIFCELMDDYGWELYWTEDFGIKAKYRGRDIEFAQMSGGEQMCAALSIRLALLKTTSNAGIVFFDEPTQNMDDVRRRNLASQLSRIEGFEQIVVISHDATFEEMVENAVKVRKNGVSIVEQ